MKNWKVRLTGRMKPEFVSGVDSKEAIDKICKLFNLGYESIVAVTEV